MHANPQTIRYIVTAVVIGLVMILRLRTMGRARRLSLDRLWILPAILAIVFVAAIIEHPPHGATGWLALAAAAGLGAILGWRRGKLMRIHVDPATGTLSQTTSPAALLFIVLLLVARMGLRYEAAAHGIDLMTVTGLLMALAVGLVTATRAEMFTRARRILAA